MCIIPVAARLQGHWVNIWQQMCLKAIPPERRQSHRSIRMLGIYTVIFEAGRGVLRYIGISQKGVVFR